MKHFLSITLLFLAICIKAQSPFCFTSMPTTYSLGIRYPGGANGDFNGDGKQDFFCVAGYFVHGLLSNSTNSMTQVSYTINTQYSLARCVAADMNNDGRMDLVANDPFTNSVYCVLLGDGGGGFYGGGSAIPPTSPMTFDAGDLNNDGTPELISCDISSPSLKVMSFNGFLYNTSMQLPLTYIPSEIIAKDFNNDGRKDVLISNGSNITIFKGFTINTFGGTFNLASLPANFKGLNVADFNNDGKLDFSVLSGSMVSIYSGNGNFGFSLSNTFSINPDYSFIKVGDFDSDGKKDLIATSVSVPSNLTASIYRNLGSNNFAAPYIHTFTVMSTWEYVIGLSVANFNGDTKDDFLLLFDNSAKGVEINLNCNTIGLTENIGDEQSVSLYPNPASDIVNIELTTNQENSDYKKVVIYNQLGQAIKEETLYFESGKTKINTSDLSNGAYYVSISDESGFSAKRVLVVSR